MPVARILFAGGLLVLNWNLILLLELVQALEGGWLQARIQKKLSGVAHQPHSPTHCPYPASESSHENFPYLTKERRQEEDRKEAGERSELRKFGVFGRKVVPK